MGRTRFCDALVLRAVDYRDADRIVTLLTRELGKVSALARGARRSKRRFGGSLEPCCLLSVELGETRSDLHRLAQASVKQAFAGILTDLRRITVAGACLEVARELVPMSEPDERVFDVVVELFTALDAGGGDELLWAFTLRLLALLGFTPGLDVCALTGERAPEGQAALFSPREGSIVSRAAGGGPVYLTGATRSRLVAALGNTWASPEPWSERHQREARQLLEGFIEHQLGRRSSAFGALAVLPAAPVEDVPSS